MWYFLGVLCDGWIEERLFTVIVYVMAIIKSSCTGQLGWQLSIIEGQPFAYGNQSCLCIRVLYLRMYVRT